MSSAPTTSKPRFSEKLLAVFRLRRSNSAPQKKVSYPLGYFASLDGLRGLMTMGVIVAHINYTWLPGSVIFMDAFFVMSAYLITSILLKSYQASGQLQFKTFYTRRFKRIFPAYYAMLLCFVPVALYLNQEPVARLQETAVAGLYMANWFRAFAWLDMPYLGHTWSLSIEEQYYLIWPLIFLGFLKLLSLKPRLLLAVLVVTAVAVAWRYHLAVEKVPVARLFNGLDTRADALFLGCVLALVQRLFKPFERPKLVRTLQWLSYPIFFVLAWVSSRNLYFSHEYYAWGAVSCSVLSTLFIAALISPNNQTYLRRMLEWPVFVGTGRICYGLYLWHFPIIQLLKRDLGLDDLQVTLVAVPLSFLAAGASYRWIEKPFLTSKKRYQGVDTKPSTPPKIGQSKVDQSKASTSV